MNADTPRDEAGLEKVLSTLNPAITDAPSLTALEAKLSVAIEAQDWTTAVRMIGDHWSGLLDRQSVSLDRALRLVPIEEFQHDSRAAALRDIRMHSSADAVERMLGAVTLPDPEDTARLEALARTGQALSLLSVASARMIALRVRGHAARAARLAVLVERFGHLAEVHQPALMAERLPAALLQAGITRGLADDLPGAVLALRDAYERSHGKLTSYVERDAAGKLALFLALNGDIAQAERWLKRYDGAPAAHGWARPRVALTADIARAIVATETLQHDSAEHALGTLDQPVNSEQSWGPAVTYARARYALAWGDQVGALDSLRTDRERYAHWLGSDTTMGPLLIQAEVDLLLSLGRTYQAELALGPIADHPLHQAASSRVALRNGDVVGAARHAGATLRRAGSTRARIDALLVQSAAETDRARSEPGLGSYDDVTAAIRGSRLLFPALAIHQRAHLDDLLPEAHGARDTLRLDPDCVRITPQQRVVLDGLQRGLTNRQIGQESYLSINTVKSHVQALYRRLGVSTREEVVARAYDLGLL